MRNVTYNKQYITDKHLAKWMNNSKRLKNIITHTQNIILLREQLRQYLQPPLRDLCTVINFSSTTLTMNADTSALASKLRYIQYDILEFVKYHCGLSQIKNIQIQVKSQYDQEERFSQSHPPRKALLSKNSAECLKKVADSITDIPLREVMLKISRHKKVD